MPLITKPPEPPKKEQIRIRLTKTVLDEMDAYCKWQGLDRDYFIERAVEKILAKDKEWLEEKGKAN